MARDGIGESAPQPAGSTWASRSVLLCILIAGAVLRFWGLDFGLPHTYARPDEEKIVQAALGILQGDLNPHLFLYPSLYIYLVAAGYWMLYIVQHLAGTAPDLARFVALHSADPSTLHLVGRGLTALTGVATIAVLAALGRELFSTRVGLVAAALLAVTFLHVRDSHFGVTDVPVTFMVMCALYTAARCFTRGVTRRRLLVTGLLCGLAASTKYNAVLVVIPALIAIADDAIRRKRLISGGTVLACGVLGVASIAGFLAASPYIVLDYPGFLAGFGEQSRIFAGVQNGSIIGPARSVIGERGWRHYASFTLPLGLGLPLYLASLAGACWMVATRWRPALCVLAFPAAYYVLMGNGTLVYARYVVPLIPFACLAAGFLIVRIADSVGTWLAFRRSAVACAVGLSALLGGPTLATSLALDRVIARPDTRVLGAHWVESRFPEGGSVYQTGVFYGYIQPRPAKQFRVLRLDDATGRFEIDGRPTAELPDIIVRLDSPLVVYSRVPARLQEILDANYRLEHVFRGSAAPDSAPAVYDQQDAIYLPLAEMWSVRRPGPDVSIYVRRRPS
jgi:hypothetical protein